jgi:hypothetical protein
MTILLSLLNFLLAIFNLFNAYRNHSLAKQMTALITKVSKENMVILSAMDKYEADLGGKSQAIQYIRSQIAASIEKS